MSIIVNEKTPVIVQGFTGRMGTFHAEEMIKYGTNLVGGIAPGKSGSDHLGLPVFDTVKDAVNETGAEASIVFGLQGPNLTLVGPGHDEGQALHADQAGREADDPHGPELRRRDQSRQGLARDHARPHLRPGPGGHHRTLRNAGL